MAEDMQRLVVSLEARIDKFQKALDKATGVANSRSRAIEKRFGELNARATASFAKLGGVIAAGFSLHKMQELVTEAQNIDNALKVAGLSGTDLQRVYDQLFASAQRAGVPFESLVTVFSQLTLAQDTLHATTDELVTLTDSVALALRASGKSASEAQGALLQFEQMLSSGTVRAQEFNSVMQNARPILQAAAAGLQEAHGSVAELHHLVLQGKVSSEAFFRAMEAGRPILEEKVANATLTLSGKLEILQNALIKSAGQMDKATGLSGALGAGLDGAAKHVQGAGDIFERNARRIALAWEAISNAVTFNFTGAGDALAQLDAAMADSNLAAFPRNFAEGMARAEAAAKSGAANIKQVSLKDFAPPAGEDNEAKRTTFERESEQIRKRTEALRAERQVIGETEFAQARAKAAAELRFALDQTIAKEGRKATAEELRSIETLSDAYAGLNVQLAFLGKMQELRFANEDLQAEISLTGLLGAELEKARTEQELLTAAKRAGVVVTPEMRAEIALLAERNAKLKETQQIIADTRDTARDALGGFIRDVRDGTSATEALGNALNRIADKLIDMGTNALVEAALGPLFGGSATAGRGGGLFGGAIIPGILHDGGVAGRDGYGHGRAVSPSAFRGARRYHSGGIAGLKPDEVPAILQRGEMVIPRIGNVTRGTAGGSGGDAAPVVVNATFNVQNGTPEGVDKLKTEIVPLMRKIAQTELVSMFERNARFARSGI